MQLIWFRQDLRIQDHAALWHATRSGNCVALVILSPEQWQQHDDSPAKQIFYLRQLETLKSQLHQLNIPLLIKHIPLWKNVPHEMLQLCQRLGIDAVHANIEIGVNELKRDAQTQEKLENHQIPFELYHDQTIFPVGSICNKSNQSYQVFSAFKKRCYELLSIGLPQCYPAIAKQEKIGLNLEVENMEINALTDMQSSASDQLQQLWPVTENYALTILDHFIDTKLEHYQQERDFPHLNSTSQLSPYLNIGAVSIRQCLQAVFRKQNGDFHIDNAGQQTWLDELLWREFYQHILYQFPAVSKHQPFKNNTLKIKWRNAEQDLLAWQQGQTGIPIVDAGMRQLLQTGWMHNRVRMITAMFLTKNLLIDWRLGEKWFMQHLIDGNLAANNGGWQWCASTGTDAVPYFRIFNPITQSQKFDKDGDYIRTWIPELAHLDAKKIHDPYAFAQVRKLNYPRAIVDLNSSRKRAIEVFKAI
ncbi:cryptochrome/photolyase family protein [Acinetobacter kookii]